MLPVKIDMSGVIGSFDLSEEEVKMFSRALVTGITNRFVSDLTAEAKLRLKQTRREYVRSINVSNINNNTTQVELIGFLPNAVEQGLDPFDQKSGFAHSPKAKIKMGGGWYLTIPYTHAWAGALGEAETFSSGTMPEEVWSVAKGLGEGESLQASDLSPKYRTPMVRQAVMSRSRVFEEYRHKASLYQGMVRSSKPSHAGYTTFRRVSDKSDPDSWIHTGIIARNLFQSAFNDDHILHEIDIIRDKFFGALGL